MSPSRSSRSSTAKTFAPGRANADGATPARHPFGPRPLAALMPKVMQPALSRQPAAGAQLAVDWGVIVGAHMAQATAPRRLSGGTLTVACAGPAALELQHQATLLIERINRHMGHALVQRLRLVHEAVAPPPAVTPPPTRAGNLAVVEQRLAGVPAGPLRDALVRLGMALGAG